MILFIDTSDFAKIKFAFVSDKILQKTFPISRHDSEKTLEYLLKFLPKKTQIKKIYVVSGPGSFTGIRTGIAIALAFGLGLGAEVFALKKNQISKNLKLLEKTKARKINASFTPDYGSAPKITKEKKKKLKNT